METQAQTLQQLEQLKNDLQAVSEKHKEIEALTEEYESKKAEIIDHYDSQADVSAADRLLDSLLARVNRVKDRWVKVMRFIIYASVIFGGIKYWQYLFNTWKKPNGGSFWPAFGASLVLVLLGLLVLTMFGMDADGEDETAWTIFFTLLDLFGGIQFGKFLYRDWSLSFLQKEVFGARFFAGLLAVITALVTSVIVLGIFIVIIANQTKDVTFILDVVDDLSEKFTSPYRRKLFAEHADQLVNAQRQDEENRAALEKRKQETLIKDETLILHAQEIELLKESLIDLVHRIDQNNVLCREDKGVALVSQVHYLLSSGRASTLKEALREYDEEYSYLSGEDGDKLWLEILTGNNDGLSESKSRSDSEL